MTDKCRGRKLAGLLACALASAIVLVIVIAALNHRRGASRPDETPGVADSSPGGSGDGISDNRAAGAGTTGSQAPDAPDIGFTRASRGEFLNLPAADVPARLYPALCLSLDLGRAINGGGALDGARVISEEVKLARTRRAPRPADFAADLVPDAERVVSFGKFYGGTGFLLVAVESAALAADGRPKFAGVAVAPNPFMQHADILGEDGSLRPGMTDLDVRLPVDPVLADGYRLTVYMIQPRTLVEWIRKDIPPAR